jgi:hypothetical protein
MERPQPPPTPGRHFWAVLLLLVIATTSIVGVLTFLTLGMFLPVVIGVGGLFLMALFHYLVWGWWLGSIIRAEELENDDEL